MSGEEKRGWGPFPVRMVLVPLCLLGAAVVWMNVPPSTQETQTARDSTLALLDSTKKALDSAKEVPPPPQEPKIDTVPTEFEVEEPLNTFYLVYDCPASPEKRSFVVGTLNKQGRLEVRGWYNLAPGDSVPFRGIGHSLLAGVDGLGVVLVARQDSVMVPTTVEDVFAWTSTTALESQSALMPESATMRWTRGRPEQEVKVWEVPQRAEFLCGR